MSLFSCCQLNLPAIRLESLPGASACHFQLQSSRDRMHVKGFAVLEAVLLKTP